MSDFSVRPIWRLLLLGVWLFTMAACTLAGPVGGAAPTATLLSSAEPAIPTDTPAPTPTETPQPPLVLLVAGSQADPGLNSDLQTMLTELAAQSGFRFQVRPALTPTDLDSDVRVVVALPPDPGLATLAAGAPDIQFLGVGLGGLQPAANLSLVGAHGDRPDQQGFLAGYLAAVITPDWRTGIIVPQDNPQAQLARQAFVNGVVFFCGLCRPAYPPFYQYPLYAELPAGAGTAEQQAAADYMIDHAVETVYVFPGSGGPELVDYLAKNEVHIIGSGAPPAGAQDQWVASIQTDLLAAVRQIWPDLLAGKGAADLATPMVISHSNPDLFSPGRQRLVEQTLQDLQSGFIDPGVNSDSESP